MGMVAFGGTITCRRGERGRERTGRRDEPLSAAAREQPRKLATLGRRGARAGARGGQADSPEHWLRGVPLVPRDGARVVRGSGHREGDERAVREHQGRPRGAPGHRRNLHERGAGDDRPGRMADDDVPHAGGRSVPRRHVLPANGPSRDAVVRARAALGGRCVSHQAWRCARHRGARARAIRGRAAGGGEHGRAHGGAARPRCAGHRRALRRAQRRLRGRTKISADDGARLSAPPLAPERRAAGARDRAQLVRADGTRRHLRSGGWRLPSLRGGRSLARAAFREDALRQRASLAARRASRSGDARRRDCAGDARDVRLGAARDGRAERRLLLVARRR